LLKVDSVVAPPGCVTFTVAACAFTTMSRIDPVGPGCIRRVWFRPWTTLSGLLRAGVSTLPSRRPVTLKGCPLTPLIVGAPVTPPPGLRVNPAPAPTPSDASRPASMPSRCSADCRDGKPPRPAR
jgi:hypothetical protein